MEKLYLSTNELSCFDSDFFVFIDPSDGTFRVLNRKLSRALLQILDSPGYGAEPLDDEALALRDYLLKKKILTREAGKSKMLEPPADRESEVVVLNQNFVRRKIGRRVRIGAREIGQIFQSYIFAMTFLFLIRIRMLSVRDIQARCSRLASRAAGRETFEEPELLSVLGKFFEARKFVYNVENRCLLDALVLFEFLTRHGFRPRLLIGVCASPFLAHSWIELDQYCVNNDRRLPGALTPILAS